MTYVYSSQIQQDARYIRGTRVYSCVWRLWAVFLEHGGGALDIFKPPVCTCNQAWTFLFPLHTTRRENQAASLHLQSSMDFSFSASHNFSLLSKRSGRSALYICIYLEHDTENTTAKRRHRSKRYKRTATFASLELQPFLGDDTLGISMEYVSHRKGRTLTIL